MRKFILISETTRAGRACKRVACKLAKDYLSLLDRGIQDGETLPAKLENWVQFVRADLLDEISELEQNGYLGGHKRKYSFRNKLGTVEYMARQQIRLNITTAQASYLRRKRNG